jgi:hypothetical protein
MGIGENIIKHWKYYAIVMAMISLSTWVYNRGGDDNEIENRIFSTKEIKYETEKYMEEKPSAIQEQKIYILDSIEKVTNIENNKSAQKSRAMRDSVYLQEVKDRKRTDSINLLNADQMYQIKVEFKEIKELLINNNN